jgi:excisionase family DNA binding protein
MDANEKLAHGPAEAAQLLSLSRRTIDNLLKFGKLKGFKVGRRMLIKHSELEKFINVGTAKVR